MNIPKNFSKILKLLAAAPLLASSMAVNAGLIEVNYEGSVTYNIGTEFGYSVGDFLSGTLVIDTDLLPSNSSSSAYVSNYVQQSASGGEFVSGGIDNDDGAYDQLYIVDVPGGYERLYLSDRDYEYTYTNYSNFSYEDNFLTLDIWDQNLDFLSGVSINQELDLDLAGFDNARGTLYSREFERSGGVTNTNTFGYTSFALTSLSVAQTSVPTPNTLALLGLGLIGLGAMRRHNSRKSA